MKANILNKKEIKELEEMAMIGKDIFPGDLNQVEKKLAERIEDLPTRDELNPQSRSFSKSVLILVLVATILGSAFFLLTYKENKAPTLKYAMAYYETPPFVISEGERGSSGKTTLVEQISVAYKDREYKSILNLITDDNKAEIKFYRAIALIELERYEEAIAILQQNSGGELEDMRLWYLALGQLQSKNTNEATSVLEQIIQMPQHYKRQSAVDLLEKISE